MFRAFLYSIICIALVSCAKDDAIADKDVYPFKTPTGFSEPYIPDHNPLTYSKIKLGKKLGAFTNADQRRVILRVVNDDRRAVAHIGAVDPFGHDNIAFSVLFVDADFHMPLSLRCFSRPDFPPNTGHAIRNRLSRAMLPRSQFSTVTS